MLHKLKGLLFLVFSLLIYISITGCSVKGSIYTPDNNLTNKLNNYNLQSVNVEKIYNANLVNSTSLALRGANLVSPYGSNFQDYLEESLKTQLNLNSLFELNSEITINIKFLSNSVDLWGFSEGNYTLSANFTIIKKGSIVYDETKTIFHTFPSHFVGQIAIENGINNYPFAIQKLISSFLNDSKVLEILKSK
jgi:predicted small lipoprotein YifL